MLVLATFLLSVAQVPALAPPFRLTAGDAPISVDVGHAYPRLHDLDGDGDLDLLVGQFGEGQCRIYENVGGAAAPEFAAHRWLMAGDRPASVAAS